MLDRIELLARRARRWLNRSEWAVRLLGLSRSRGAAAEPGLIMLQIDGLSRRQMERAMAAGRLPFLRHLLKEQQYRTVSHYSGLPSSTPAVQGELFYGVRTAVPAFSFYDHQRRRTLRMFEPQAGDLIERQIESRGEPLLSGGSSYANVYSGGAQETHFCASTMGLPHLYRQAMPLTPMLLLLFNPYSLLRTAVLVSVEFALALLDAARGLIAGRDLWKELKFVPSRVGICVLLRELVTIGAKIDAARGLPVIHANFLGYDEQAHRTIIAAMGPVAHVYLRRESTSEENGQLAGKLVRDARIPMVLYVDAEQRCRAVSKVGTFMLPEQAEALLGPEHPFAGEAARDLVQLCHHPDAGTFVLCGWSRHQEPVSFAVESGSHAGPGPEETGGFALLPKDTPLQVPDKGYVRPTDLRLSALEILGRRTRISKHRALRWKESPKCLRVMTYNAHSCIGLDGRLSPRRIARVIAWHDPDVVALQEIDVGRARTQGHDQARLIAELLWMEHHFYPSLRLAEESYGDAIMSRWPMALIQAGPLPHPPRAVQLEPRGALWVAINLQGRVVHVVNTHFGLRRYERVGQVQALLSKDWLGQLGRTVPVVLCGDFNSVPGSPPYRALAKRFRDVQTILNGHRPVNTWFGRYPVSRIDHIFISDHFAVARVEVGDFDLARLSSDHRPLLAELNMRYFS